MIIGLAAEWFPASQEEKQRAAEAVNVGEVIGAAGVLRLLGRHVVDSPHVHAALGQPAGATLGLAERLGCLDDPRQPEVEHADHALGIEHQV